MALITAQVWRTSDTWKSSLWDVTLTGIITLPPWRKFKICPREMAPSLTWNLPVSHDLTCSCFGEICQNNAGSRSSCKCQVDKFGIRMDRNQSFTRVAQRQSASPSKVPTLLAFFCDLPIGPHDMLYNISKTRSKDQIRKKVVKT